MKNHFYLIVFLVFFPAALYGQQEYYATDSMYFGGVDIVDRGDRMNSRFCHVQEGTKVVRYSPSEVKEYGFGDGRVYVSTEISLNGSSSRVFLERLVDGDATLYYYRGKQGKAFFIEKGDDLFKKLGRDVESGKQTIYREALRNLTADCPQVADLIDKTSYSKPSMTQFMENYNKCDLKPFPHFRYGLQAGLQYSRLNPDFPEDTYEQQVSYLELFDLNYEGGFAAGFFVDLPLFASAFSIHAEVLYSRHRFSYTRVIDENVDLSLDATTGSINLPVMIRYAPLDNWGGTHLRPFLNAGAVFSYHLENDHSLFESSIGEEGLEKTPVYDYSFLPDKYAGYSIGGGMEYMVSSTNSLFFELRYHELYGSRQGEESEMVDKSGFYIICGINF